MTSPVVEPFVIMGPHFHSLSPESLIPVMKLPPRAARCAGISARARAASPQPLWLKATMTGSRLRSQALTGRRSGSGSAVTVDAQSVRGLVRLRCDHICVSAVP